MSQPVSTVRSDSGPLIATGITTEIPDDIVWFACEGYWGDDPADHVVAGNAGVTFIDGWNENPSSPEPGRFYVTVPAGIWLINGYFDGLVNSVQHEDGMWAAVFLEDDDGEILSRIDPQSDGLPENWHASFSGWLDVRVPQRLVCENSFQMVIENNEATHLQISGIRLGEPEDSVIFVALWIDAAPGGLITAPDDYEVVATSAGTPPYTLIVYQGVSSSPTFSASGHVIETGAAMRLLSDGAAPVGPGSVSTAPVGFTNPFTITMPSEGAPDNGVVMFILRDNPEYAAINPIVPLAEIGLFFVTAQIDSGSGALDLAYDVRTATSSYAVSFAADSEAHAVLIDTGMPWLGTSWPTVATDGLGGGGHSSWTVNL